MSYEIKKYRCTLTANALTNSFKIIQYYVNIMIFLLILVLFMLRLFDIFGSSDRPLVKEDLLKMKYLERVVKESLRLFPPVPFIIRKVLEEITLRKYTLRVRFAH